MNNWSTLPYASPTANREVFNIRDEATPNAKDGTPMRADMMMDTMTTWVRLITSHLGESLSGVPENSVPVGNDDSQIYRGLVKLIQDTTAAAVGAVTTFPYSGAITGYLLCDGSAVSRLAYADLFAAIGTTWGAGNGSTTFNLPDFRGIFLRGSGTHGSLLKANGGAVSGPAVGAYANDMMQGHTHSLTGSDDSGQGFGSDGFFGSDTPKRCRELLGKGLLYRIKEGKFKTFYPTEKFFSLFELLM